MPQGRTRRAGKRLRRCRCARPASRASITTAAGSAFTCASSRTARASGCSVSPSAASGVSSGSGARRSFRWPKRGSRRRRTSGKREGGDPLAEKRKARARPTFAEAVNEYLAGKLAEFRNDKHRKQWRATLDTYAAPGFRVEAGRCDRDPRRAAGAAADLGRQDRDCVAAARAHRGRAVLGDCGWAPDRRQPRPMDRQPGRAAGEAREGGEGRQSPGACARRRAALVARTSRLREGMAARALQFIALTAARSGEVRGMTWPEVDLEKALWTIPAGRMKAGREHRVPADRRGGGASARACPEWRAAPTCSSPHGAGCSRT